MESRTQTAEEPKGMEPRQAWRHCRIRAELHLQLGKWEAGSPLQRGLRSRRDVGATTRPIHARGMEAHATQTAKAATVSHVRLADMHDRR